MKARRQSALVGGTAKCPMGISNINIEDGQREKYFYLNGLKRIALSIFSGSVISGRKAAPPSL